MPWSAWIHTGFHVSRATQDTAKPPRVFDQGAFTLFGQLFQVVGLAFGMLHRGPTTPEG